MSSEKAVDEKEEQNDENEIALHPVNVKLDADSVDADEIHNTASQAKLLNQTSVITRPDSK